MTYSIRSATRADIDLFVEWAAREGWNPGVHDADAFFAADPHGFFVGELDRQPVATISVVAYDDTFGFLGFYIVDEAHRGRGFGYQLWQHAMRYLGKRNVGLDGVVTQQANYRRSGFRYAYGNQRCEGIGFGDRDSDAVPLQEIDTDAVLRYDRQCFPSARATFLSHWFNHPDVTALGLVEKDTLKGYGVIRRCRQGHKIGPLFADSAEYADRLFVSLASHVHGDTLYLDVPLLNRHAVALAQRYDLNPVFETARMYTGNNPKIDIDKIFGVTTFELG